MPQGSVLSPTLFNIYTNDQAVHGGTRSFIYADDLCTTAQFPTFSQVENTIKEALGELTEYYRNSSLRANPDKTLVTAFHLRNRETKRCCCLPTPMTLASGGIRCSGLWSTSQLLHPSGQQCSHSGGVCPQIQG